MSIYSHYNKIFNIIKSVLKGSAIVFCALFLFLASEAKATTYYCTTCDECQEKINNAIAGDVIYLNDDIFDVTKTCLEFNGKSDIVFDCSDGVGGQYVIDGIGSRYYDDGYSSIYGYDYDGIYVNNSNNITIKNCYITDFNKGVVLNGSDDNIIFNLNLQNNIKRGLELSSSNNNLIDTIIAKINYRGIYLENSYYNILNNSIIAENSEDGLYLYNSDNNQIDSFVISSNYTNLDLRGVDNSTFNNLEIRESSANGIYLSSSDNNVFSNLTLINNNSGGFSWRYGWYFSGSDNNTISTSTIKWNKNKDIYIATGNGNLFYDNNFVSKDIIVDNGANQWSINYIGNHWDNFDDESEGCYDSFNYNGICDDGTAGDISYALDADSVDYAPKYISSVSKHYCHTCTDCNSKIASTTPGDIVYLLDDIEDQNGNCIDLSYSTSTTFDCQDHQINGDNDAVGNGIYLNNGGNSGDITISNCKISGFDNGLYIENSNDNTIIDNIIEDNTNYDIYLYSSIGNVFYDNKFISNSSVYGVIGNYWNNINGVNNIAPGNYWRVYDGINDACVDSDNDGYCDTPYFVGGWGAWRTYDYYPHYQGPYNAYSCDSCADCNAKIAAALSGDVITLSKTIINATNTCIIFNNQQGVTFDCNGYIIDGAGSGYGIYILGSGLNDNNVIKNCYITDFDYGIYIDNSNANIIQSVSTVYSNKGIYLNNSDSNVLNEIESYYNNIGLYLYSSDSNTISNGETNYNNDGFYLDNSYSNIFDTATSSDNKNNGFYFYASGGNTVRNSTGITLNPININIISDGGVANVFYSNHFISPNKIEDGSSITQWDNGTIGNWWESYDVDTEGCYDINIDNICDAGYVVGDLGTIDNYPIWKAADNNTFHCSSCAECSLAIKKALYGDEVILDNDIWDVDEDCIIFIDYKEGVSFDGNGYFIQSINSLAKAIIFNEYTEDNIVKNMDISGFDYCSYSYLSEGNLFFDINCAYNNFGFYFDDSSNNNLENLNFLYNNNSGVYLLSSENNVIKNNNIIGNNVSGSSGGGVYIFNSNNNIIFSSTIKNDNINDIYISSFSTNNIFYNNNLVSRNTLNINNTTNYWDNGSYGNWWEAFDSDSEGCYDINSDTICDNGVTDSPVPYEVIVGSNDNYPRYKGPSAVFSCDSCDSCNEVIDGASYGDVVNLTEDISSLGDCIIFNNKSGIIFDCGERLIKGNGYTGIKINGYDNIIKNCQIVNFSYNIEINGSYNKVDNIESIGSDYNIKIDGNYNNIINSNIKGGNYGVYVDGFYNSFDYLLVGSTKYAFYFLNSSYNNLTYSDIQNNSSGLYFKNSDNNLIASSTIRRNGGTDVYYNIYLDNNSNENIFHSNQIISSYKIVDNGSNHWNNWDNVNNKNIKPGNHWENYDVVQEGCGDIDNNKYCDSIYNQNGIIDNYPKYYGIIDNYTCDSCDTCTNAINNALFGETVQLLQDINGVSDNCFQFVYSEGVHFDGNHHKLNGLGTSNAIYLYKALFNKIYNLETYSFLNGFYLYQSYRNLIKNISSLYNNDDTTNFSYGSGIILNGSSDNIIVNATTTNNEAGVYVKSSSNSNKITDLFSKDNGYGLMIEYSDDNIASSSSIISNSIDIYITNSHSENNVLYNNKLNSAINIQDYGTNTKWDNGLSTGGNIWDDFNEDAEGCYDADNNNICDDGDVVSPSISTYQIDDGSDINDGGISVDNYPLRGENIITNTYYCNSCESCSDAILNSNAGDIIKLTQNIIGVGNDICIDFNNFSGRTFDCQDYLINGNNVLDSIGILTDGDNNIIKNCFVSGFDIGLKVLGANNNFDNIVVKNCNKGIFLDGGEYNYFSNIVSNNNSSDGFSLYNYSKYNILNYIETSFNGGNGITTYYYSTDNKFSNIKSFYNNGKGIWFGKLNKNDVVESVFKWNGSYDVYLDRDACNVLFYNNDFVSKDYIYDEGGKDTVFCGGSYPTKWDNGSIGNHWEEFDDESEGCYDADDNGVCDDGHSPPTTQIYNVDSADNRIDHYPKYIGSLTVHYCNSCFDCNTKIASTTAGDTVYLVTDILDQSGHCLNFSDAYNITFDCQNYLIDGDNDAVGNGVYLDNGGNDGLITIQNCTLQEFNNGVYIYRSDANKFVNNIIKDNVNKDIVIDSTSNTNIFYGNDFSSEGDVIDNGINTHWNSYDGVSDNAPGNHWDAYDESGEGCNDVSPTDGYCDIAYTITSSGAKDYYPKYKSTIGANECSSCIECSNKINTAVAGQTIYLTSDIIDYKDGNCINFNNSNITLDCQGHTIDGDDIADSSGIIMSFRKNNVIKNCRITNFDYGLYLDNSSTTKILDVAIENNQKYGIFFVNADYNYVHNNKIVYNKIYGFYVSDGSDFNKIDESLINDNTEVGLYLSDSDYNISTSSEIRFNKINILLNAVSNSNTFYNNHFISKNKINDEGSGNVWDNGSDLGNWWEDFDWSSEGCSDSDTNGICDTKYTIGVGIYDNYPIYKGSAFNRQDKTCDSCLSCSQLIRDSYYGEKISLIQDINANGNCINFYYNEGINFNCNDYFIIGNNTGSGIYVFGYGEENNKINNCYINNFGSYGIKIEYSSNNIFDNIAVQNSGNSGIGCYQTSDNYFSNLNVMYNNNNGISLSKCNDNIFSNIISNNNNWKGLELYDSDSNIINSATTSYNNSIGIYILGYNNVINSSNINNIQYNNIGLSIYCPPSPSSYYNVITNTNIKKNKTNDVYIDSSCLSINNVYNKFYNNEFIVNTNISDYSETSIWDNGSYGNWWEAFDSDEEGCHDANSDSICDDGDPANPSVLPYQIKPGVYDNYPKYKGVGFNSVITCDSCVSCSQAIQSAYYGTKVLLTTDIYSYDIGPCIDFGAAKGITFSCEDSVSSGRFSIVSTVSGGTGVSINITGTSSNVIEFCDFKYFEEGLILKYASDNIIASSSFNSYSSGSYGIQMSNANNNRLYNIDVSYNENGVYLSNSNNNIFNDIKAVYDYDSSSCAGGGKGIYFDSDSDNNTVAISTIKYYPTTIDVQGVNNSFYKNHFISSITINDTDNGTIWNSNYWEACKDSDSDGKCDGGYWKDANAFYDGGNNIYTCVGCDDCNEKIRDAKYGDTIILNQDLINNIDTCIKFIRKEGVYFTGAGCFGGCTIDGIGNGYGIYMCGGGENLISDLGGVFDFDYGIYLLSSQKNTFNKLNVDYNNYGIYSKISSDNIFYLLVINSNYDDGIYFYGSDNNNVNKVISKNNSNYGLRLYEADNNNISFSTSSNNNYGIDIYTSNSNTISSSTIKDNITKDISISWASNNNIFYANELLGNNKVQESSNVFWNRRESTSDVTPGNHWEFYDEPAEGCNDLVVPYGYCDDPYYINTSYNPDYYPIKPSHMPTDFNITVAEVGYSPITHSSSTCKVVLVWENNGDADEYIIYRSIDGGLTYTELTRVSWNTSYYIDENSTDIVNSIAGGYGFSYYIEARNGPYYKSSTCDRLDDHGTVINPHCAVDDGSETITLYPTICSPDLKATTTDCSAVSLNWNDVTPNDNYYITRSDDGGINYKYACSDISDPAFSEYCIATTTIADINSADHPNGTIYYFQDTDATSSQYFYYQIKNCVGTTPCYNLNKCQPTVAGPRDNCYVESNILKINPCPFPAPRWIEVGP